PSTPRHTTAGLDPRTSPCLTTVSPARWPSHRDAEHRRAGASHPDPPPNPEGTHSMRTRPLLAALAALTGATSVVGLVSTPASADGNQIFVPGARLNADHTVTLP